MSRGEALPVPVGWLAGATAAAGVAVGIFYGLPLGVLFLAGGVLVGVVLLVWASVQSLTGSTPLSLEEAISLGAPTTEEEQKQSVLRALKDLEYERSVGKISEADYRELSARYRAEAKALLKALDHDLEPNRNRVLSELEQRLAATGTGTAAPSAVAGGNEAAGAHLPAKESQPEPEASAAASAMAPVTGAGRIDCRECGARNEGDARFCKGCGARLVEDGP
jgi:hypothetical protein